MQRNASIEEVFHYVDEHADRMVHDLQRFVRQPSDSANNIGLEECAVLLREIMLESGIRNARLMPGEAGPPVVFAELTSSTSDLTLLCTGHYDVVPAGPADEWIVDPYSAEIVDGIIYGRGVADNKGGVMAFIKAAEAFLEVRGEPPVHLKFVTMGEEEIGDPHLMSWVAENLALLKADGMANLDGGIDAGTHTPRLYPSVRSLLYVQFDCKGSDKDVHGGLSPLVVNPAWRLVKALDSMVDGEGNILIDHWNDELDKPRPDELELIQEAADQIDVLSLKAYLGVKELPPNRTMVELLVDRHFRPTATICGLTAGYGGPGVMDIVPHHASAKVVYYLPRDLDPDVQIGRVQDHLDRHGFDDVKMTVLFSKHIPWRVDLRSGITQAAMRASLKVFGRKPVPFSVTSPAVLRSSMYDLGADIPFAITAFGPPITNLHSPNELMPVDYYIRGIKYAAAIMEEFAAEK